MWDIKFTSGTSKLKRKLFHLNHVGYKVISAEKAQVVMIEFHLNHVGYKDEEAKKDIKDVQGFI